RRRSFETSVVRAYSCPGQANSDLVNEEPRGEREENNATSYCGYHGTQVERQADRPDQPPDDEARNASHDADEGRTSGAARVHSHRLPAPIRQQPPRSRTLAKLGC